MKRQRQEDTSNPSKLIDSESNTKYSLTDQSTLVGPFSLSPAFHDFWFDTAQYLPSRSLYQLSCVSKNLFTTVWTTLIPASPHGLIFPADSNPSYPLETLLGEYLTRVPKLKALTLHKLESHFFDSGWCDLLTKVQHLVSLSLPSMQLFFPYGKPFFERIAFLTALTHLKVGVLTYDKGASNPVSFGHFKKLKDLSIGTPTNRCISELGKHTQLEKLSIEGFHDRSVAPTTLTNLTELCLEKIGPGLPLERIDPSNVDFGFGAFTNLTKLKLDKVFRTNFAGVTLLPNLKSLNLRNIIDSNPPLQEIISHLTCLQELKVFNDPLWGARYTQTQFTEQATIQLSSLTNLKCLSLPFNLLPPPLLWSLTSLTDLEMTGSLVRFETLSCLTNLEFLSFCPWKREGLTPVQHLTNLKNLSMVLPESSFSAPLDLSPITNLQKLEIRDCKIPIGKMLHALTNVTDLTLNNCQPLDEILDFVDFIPGLKHLSLLQYAARPLTQALKIISRNFPNLQSLQACDTQAHFFTTLGYHYRTEDYEPLFDLLNLQSIKVDRLPTSQFWAEKQQYFQ